MADDYENNAEQLNQHFGLAVRELREAFRWSQEQLAERADLNRSFIGEIERGLATPSLITVAKLADALQMPTSSLIEHCETRTNPEAH